VLRTLSALLYAIKKPTGLRGEYQVAGANRRWRFPFRYRGSRRRSAVAFSLASSSTMPIPIITITSDDVVQSSIQASRMSATDERFRVDFNLTDTGVKKLREFFERYTDESFI
jgi:hypothetical protein